MSSLHYTFEEVPVVLPNGEKWFASGSFHVSYRIQPAEPSVGIFRPYADDLEIADDRITLELFDAETGGERTVTMIVGDCDPIMEAIFARQLDYIRDEAMEHAAAEWDEALESGYTTRRRWF